MRLTNIDPEAPPHSTLAVTRALYNALLPYFAGGSDAPASYVVEFPLPSLALHAALMTLGATQVSPHYVLTRSVIFQLYSYASSALAPIPFPYTPTSTTDISHPVRAPKPSASSPLYSRIIPHLDSSYFKLSLCTQNDLSILHSWLNDDRVDQFWMEKGAWEAHEKFLEDKKQDPHVLPVIGSYVVAKGGVVENSAPATYSEIYWVKEDRLGQYMAKDKLEVDDYDRGEYFLISSGSHLLNFGCRSAGVHVLVGSNAHRGPHRVRAWLPSLVHYCFLDDSRTRRVFAEPNQLNTKMVKVGKSSSFRFLDLLTLVSSLISTLSPSALFVMAALSSPIRRQLL